MSKKQMIKKYNYIILTGILFFSLSGNVKSATCPLPLTKANFEINVINDNIHYDYSKTSRELSGISRTNIQITDKNHLLGLFVNDKEYSINPQFSVYGGESIGYCMIVKKIVINITVNPKIFISKEAQQFSCTRHRTEQHENLHYKFDKNAMNNHIQNMRNHIVGFFNKHYYFKNKEDIKIFFNDIANNYFQVGEQTMNNLAKPLHDRIDSAENYKKESSYCSYNENYKLQKLLELKY